MTELVNILLISGGRVMGYYYMGNLDPDLLISLVTVVDNSRDVGSFFLPRLLLWRRLGNVRWRYKWVLPLYWETLGW